MTALLLSAVAGFGGGIFATVIAGRRNNGSPRPTAAVAAEVIDPALSESLNDAAASWAAERGTPEAAGLMADKLRLGLIIQQRRGRRPKW